jgi:hypothetical protein
MAIQLAIHSKSGDTDPGSHLSKLDCAGRTVQKIDVIASYLGLGRIKPERPQTAQYQRQTARRRKIEKQIHQPESP